MPMFRKKPVVIEAIQWLGGGMEPLYRFCGMHWGRADAHDVAWGPSDDGEQVVIWNTLEQQWICCPKGHCVIRGVAGELYPCDPEVFERTYEAAP